MDLAALLKLIESIPLPQLLEALSKLQIKYPDLAAALEQVKSVLAEVPAALASLPATLAAELRELANTGLSEIPDLPLE